MTQIQLLQQMIDESERLVFFGGAGVSTESGIRDFRSANGLYRENRTIPVETLLSHRFFINNPEPFYSFYRETMLPLEALPNAAHRKLAELERCGKLTAVITQNVDGLHQKAGSRNVLELHGSIWRNYCMQCGKTFPAEKIRDSEGVPTCDCGGVIRPDVVLYQEGLPEEAWNAAVEAIHCADMMIVAGTSLTVYPAAGLLRDFCGKHLVLINRDPTPADDLAELVIRDPVGTVLAQINAK